MKCEVIVDRNCEEKIVIYTHEENALVAEIQRLLHRENALLGYRDGEVVRLDPSDVYYIAVCDGKVRAVCERESYILKERLYALEERWPCHFVKIHQSCLANLKKVDRFDTSITGTLKIYFRNGDIDYVSRRQMKTVKEKVGI